MSYSKYTSTVKILDPSKSFPEQRMRILRTELWDNLGTDILPREPASSVVSDLVNYHNINHQVCLMPKRMWY